MLMPGVLLVLAGVDFSARRREAPVWVRLIGNTAALRARDVPGN